jgi:hypothetical protein
LRKGWERVKGSDVGKNEAAVRRYIQNQEKEDKRLEQLELVAL